MPIRSSFAFLLAGVALACLVQPAAAKTRQVGSCTNNPLQYSTIQQAVSAAGSGDKVEICGGTYAELVHVTSAITLEPVPGQGTVTITLPSSYSTNTNLLDGGPAAVAQILVTVPSGSVKVENLTVDGTGFTPPGGETCSQEFLGIYFQNTGGTISGNTAQNQVLPPDLYGCQDGEGIFVENQSSGMPKLKITGNTVTNFDKNGITVSYNTAVATIENNTVTGTPNDTIAQNGIQVGFGATGTISSNQISNMEYTPGSYGASGILLYDSQASDGQSDQYSSAPKVSSNTVTNSQYGIVLEAVNGTANKMIQVASNGVSGAAFGGIGLYSAGTGLGNDFIKVTGNTISGTSPYDDIDVCSDNNTIKANTVSDSAEGGIHLDAECTEADGSSTSGINNMVSGNTIENNCVGILSGPAQGANQIGSNGFTGNTNNYEYNTDSYSCSADRVNLTKTKAGSARRMPAVQPR